MGPGEARDGDGARPTTDAELHVLIIVVPPAGGDGNDQFDV